MWNLCSLWIDAFPAATNVILVRTPTMKANSARLLLLVLWTLPALAAGQTLVFRNVQVFDGERLIPKTTVVVEGSRITAIGPTAAVPAGAREIDGSGKTLLPGFIDAHVHTISDTWLKQSAIFGVTTDLDMFTDPTMAASVKKQQAEGKLADWADLRSAGYLATAPNGHGTEYGIKVPTLTKPEEAQAWVDARIAEGSDYIKIIYDDGLEYGANKPIPTLDKATMKAVIDAAHARGKLAVVHIGSLQQAEDAINAGADGLAHLFVGASSEPNFGKLVAAHHAFVVPTLTVLNSICGSKFNATLADDARLHADLTPAMAASMKQAFPMHDLSCAGASEAVKQLAAAHVPILAGTDAGNPGTATGVSMHGEMELLVVAGLTPLEALRAATSAPAAAFHLTDRGRIATGLRADLVLVNGDPSKDIRATRDIIGVWKAGQPVDRAAWRASVAKEVQTAAERKATPAPAGSESGWIADFEESGAPKARFGAGWMVTTDQMAGGKSVGKMELTSGGAQDSKGALLITGEVVQGFAFPWSGVMFSPGAAPMQPANLSSKQAIRFWAKGDGQTYQVMVFDQKLGYRPAMQAFVAGPEWKEFVLPFTTFGVDGSGIMAIAWTAGPKIGSFELRLDNVRLE
jgi:imidazolonepropionase-like amidohydrolase